MRLPLLLPAILVLSACSPIRVPRLPSVPRPVVGASLTREAAAAELDTLLATLESVHPNLYAGRTSASISAERRRTLDELPASLSRIDWWKRLAPMVANIGDASTLLYPPGEEIRRLRDSGELLFPLDVSGDPDQGLIFASARGPDLDLAPGDRILSVNGHDTAGLVSDWMDYFGGSRDAERAATVAVIFRDLLTLEGIRAPYHLRTSKGEIAIPGLTQTAFDALQPPAQPTPNFAYRLLDPKTAYMSFHSMGGDFARYRNDLAAMFRDISAARTLIVDLRLNSGGDSRMGDELLRYVTGKPYRFAARKEWKMSSEYKDFLKSFLRPPLRWLAVEYLIPTGRKLLLAPDGKTVVFDFEPAAPKRAEPFFSGAVCVLTGPRTGGSAVMLADAIKTYRLATLVGEETGSAPGSFGESYFFRLPESHLAMQISSARFVRASGDANDASGVRPDIAVRPEPARDAALERARDCPAVQ